MKLNKNFLKFLSVFMLTSKAKKAFRDFYINNLTYYEKNQVKYNLGEYTYIGVNTSIKNRKETTIGKYCSISHSVSIGLSRHPLDCLTTHGFILGEKCPAIDNLLTVPKENVVNLPDGLMPAVKIGNDVWIGYHATIMDGVKIGDGAVIGAGALVTKDIPPYEIWGGVPAKKIGKRFSNFPNGEEICRKLLELKWWDYPPSFVEKLPFADIEKCIKLLEENTNLRETKKEQTK